MHAAIETTFKFAIRALGVIGLMVGSIGAAHATTSVQWNSPANGATFLVGTSVSPVGNASATGGSAGGLDLVLVLDSSGSMGSTAFVNGMAITRAQAQKDAAIALVNSLPAATTSISVVEFDSDANIIQPLLPLTPASNLTAIIAAINSVDASGGTNIAAGINSGVAAFGGSFSPDRSQQLLVLSDGVSNQADAVAAAMNALSAGVDAVNAVALPGATIGTLQAIATAGSGTFVDATTDLNALVGVFTGTGGNLVGIDRVEVTDPNGVTTQVMIDGFGNFMAPMFALALGDNIFTVTAFATDGTSATAMLNLIGVDNVQAIPLPPAVFLFAAGLAGLGANARRRKAKDV